MEHITGDLCLFFCLPFAHSEEMADQDISVALNGRLGEPWLSNAEGHPNIIQRFGRFPHRNSILGRETTPMKRNFSRVAAFRDSPASSRPLSQKMPRPSITPVWTQDRSAPWNAVEAAETLKKSQATRELRLALPHELSHEQRVEPVRGFCQRAFVDAGMATDIA